MPFNLSPLQASLSCSLKFGTGLVRGGRGLGVNLVYARFTAFRVGSLTSVRSREFPKRSPRIDRGFGRAIEILGFDRERGSIGPRRRLAPERTGTSSAIVAVVGRVFREETRQPPVKLTR
ncbi:hypothetical protein V0288_20150 [Pannus brasiliensis CCIBt3594]|uniref:Uncharacterized protein n=1 Tax=Pannus brasiliensis CCIBt3594 TaxID=1427578 RepID=A0AAW9QVR8_9CHRO